MRTLTAFALLFAISFVCFVDTAEANGCGGYYRVVENTYWVDGYWLWVSSGYYKTVVQGINQGGQVVYGSVWIDTSRYEWVSGYWKTSYTRIWNRDFNCWHCRTGAHG